MRIKKGQLGGRLILNSLRQGCYMVSTEHLHEEFMGGGGLRYLQLREWGGGLPKKFFEMYILHDS